MLALPWSRPGCPPPSVVLPEGEDWVTPKANKPASQPMLTNMGWLGCHGAASAAAAEEEDEEGDAPPQGGGGGAGCRSLEGGGHPP